MKTGLLISAVALLQLTAALPQKKRAVQTEVAVIYEDVQVYVHQDGVPFSTVTFFTTGGAQGQPTGVPSNPPALSTQAPAQPTKPPQPSPQVPGVPAPPAVNAPSAAPTAPKPEGPKPKPPPPPPVSTAAPEPVNTAPGPQPQAPKPENPKPQAQGPGFKSAIVYSPYANRGGCRNAEQVAQDLAGLNDFSVIRIYGTDCDQVSHALAAIKGTNKQLFAGIFDINSAAQQTQQLIDQVGENWGAINTVNIGNEAVNKGEASSEQVIGAMNTARGMLKAAGYNGPVVTVDTMVAMRDHIELCKASDYCAVNCHAFFDGNVLPEDAGDFVKDWVKQISDLSGGKKVVVTESGWPSSGAPNGKAIPSPENQKTAIESLKQAFSSNLVLYSAYDHLWMQDNVRTFNAEKHWGIMGGAPSNA